VSIAKRSDGRFIVKYKDEQGRWKQRSFKSETEARRFDAEGQYDATENERLTVLESVLLYLKNNDMSPLSVKTHRFITCGYDRKNGKHTEGPAECLATRFVDSLTRRDLETVRENCRARSMKNTSINRVTGCLEAAFRWCAENEFIQADPWARYSALKTDGAHWDGTLEDFQKVYACLPEWMQWASRTAMALCLRPGIGELFSLRWDAFQWATRSVSVWMPKVRQTKTVFPPEDYLAEARARYEADGRDGDALVCRGRRGSPVLGKTYSQAWRRGCLKAGVRIPMYAIRHIAASQMLAGGADLAAVAAQLGHRDITTTGRFYLHALPAAQKRAGMALPDLVRNGAGSSGERKQ